MTDKISATGKNKTGMGGRFGGHGGGAYSLKQGDQEILC